jgi:hypothetical protein
VWHALWDTKQATPTSLWLAHAFTMKCTYIAHTQAAKRYKNRKDTAIHIWKAASLQNNIEKAT